jgi:hypothetical protein
MSRLRNSVEGGSTGGPQRIGKKLHGKPPFYGGILRQLQKLSRNSQQTANPPAPTRKWVAKMLQNSLRARHETLNVQFFPFSVISPFWGSNFRNGDERSGNFERLPAGDVWRSHGAAADFERGQAGDHEWAQQSGALGSERAILGVFGEFQRFVAYSSPLANAAPFAWIFPLSPAAPPSD